MIISKSMSLHFGNKHCTANGTPAEPNKSTDFMRTSFSTISFSFVLFLWRFHSYNFKMKWLRMRAAVYRLSVDIISMHASKCKLQEFNENLTVQPFNTKHFTEFGSCSSVSLCVICNQGICSHWVSVRNINCELYYFGKIPLNQWQSFYLQSLSVFDFKTFRSHWKEPNRPALCRFSVFSTGFFLFLSHSLNVNEQMPQKNKHINWPIINLHPAE